MPKNAAKFLSHRNAEENEAHFVGEKVKDRVEPMSLEMANGENAENKHKQL